MPSRADSFIAIKWLFGGDHFAPSGQSFSFDADQEYQARIDRTEAGFERLVER